MQYGERMNSLHRVASRYFWRQEILYAHDFHFFFQRQSLNYSTRSLNASIVKKIRVKRPLQQVHARIIVSGLCNVFFCNCLMNAYASCGLILSTQIVFSQILSKNLVSWTILVSGLTKNGRHFEAIEAFHLMIVEEIRPNAITIASVLPAFGKLETTQMGKSVHCYWIRKIFEDNVFVETALVDMYSNFGCMNLARYLFDNMSIRNSVSWNAIISGYSESRIGEEAVQMFNIMRRKGFSPDIFTIMSLVSGCLSLQDFRVQCGIHGLIIGSGYENDQLVKTALMELYISVNFVNDAYCLFSEISKKDVVAWTLMLKGFLKNSCWKTAIEHFNKMMEADETSLDSGSLVTIISGCSSSGALRQGRRMHGLVIKTGFGSDIFLGSAVIDMYGNCANMEDAIRYFNWMEEKDIACWNALISCYGMNGYGHDAIDLFLKMKSSALSPDESTFVSVLCACSHAGLIDQGLQIFYNMIQIYNKTPTAEHYACVIDLLGRAGRLNDAYLFMKRMHLQPSLEVYNAFLSSCRIHKNFELGVEISEKFFESEPNDAGYGILLSNTYASAGNWDGVKRTRALLRSKNLKKDPGFSSIETNGEVCVFMASQKDHPQSMEIEEFLKRLFFKIKAEDYEPDTTNSVF